MAKRTIVAMPGDGIGKAVMAEAIRVLDAAGFDAEYVNGDIGWEFWCKEGNPLPNRTIELLKKHDPLLRDAINTLLGSQTLDDVKSQEGREKTRLACKAKVEELLTKEEGRKVIRDLLFTNFLYQ